MPTFSSFYIHFVETCSNKNVTDLQKRFFWFSLLHFAKLFLAMSSSEKLHCAFFCFWHKLETAVLYFHDTSLRFSIISSLSLQYQCLVLVFTKDCAWLPEIVQDIKNYVLSTVYEIKYNLVIRFSSKIPYIELSIPCMVFVDCIL